MRGLARSRNAAWSAAAFVTVCSSVTTFPPRAIAFLPRRTGRSRAPSSACDPPAPLLAVRRAGYGHTATRRSGRSRSRHALRNSAAASHPSWIDPRCSPSRGASSRPSCPSPSRCRSRRRRSRASSPPDASRPASPGAAVASSFTSPVARASSPFRSSADFLEPVAAVRPRPSRPRRQRAVARRSTARSRHQRRFAREALVRSPSLPRMCHCAFTHVAGAG